MELAPTANLGTISWKENDLNREALAFQRIILECLVPDTDWLDPGDRPLVRLSLDDTPVHGQVGCVSIDHDTIFMVMGIAVDSSLPPYPTHFLCFVKSRRFEWVLHDQCVRLAGNDEQNVQDQANHALALLLQPASQF